MSGLVSIWKQGLLHTAHEKEQTTKESNELSSTCEKNMADPVAHEKMNFLLKTSTAGERFDRPPPPSTEQDEENLTDLFSLYMMRNDDDMMMIKKLKSVNLL